MFSFVKITPLGVNSVLMSCVYGQTVVTTFSILHSFSHFM